MSEQPPAQLVAMLERLGLATAGQVASVGRRVRRLARDLPRFESVWVDALLQARNLTPFQAAEINAGRGELLRVGPYVLEKRLSHPYYVACYRAWNVDSQEKVRLAVVENTNQSSDAILRQLESLAAAHSAEPASPDIAPSAAPRASLGTIMHVGVEGGRIFAAAPWIDGRTAAEWMVHHGRFSPEVVLEIARAMLVGLVRLEEMDVCNGDVSMSSLIFTGTGDVVLSLSGLREILRPEEGYAHADLLPEAYDSLAPERVAAGTPPNTLSDIYACGCVWWHLLCGRPPLVGGSSLAKLRAAQAGEIRDVRHYAPETPSPLAAAISACLEREPSRRPESMARLAAMLGGPTRAGKEAVADCLAQAGHPAVPWTTTVRSIRKSNRTPLWIAATVCCLAAAVAILWPLGHTRFVVRGTTQVALRESAQEAPPPQKVAAESEETHVVARPTTDLGGFHTVEPHAVVPAAYRQVESKPSDLVLGGEPKSVATMVFEAGQSVRGPLGKRVTLAVPPDGLVVDKEDVRFENIDFVWREASAAHDAKGQTPGIVRLLASRGEFRGCSFQCEDDARGAISAIRWVHPAETDRADTSLPNGRLLLADCVLHRVDAGVDCHTAGALAIGLNNVLHLNAGPLVRLDHCPRADEPLSIGLSQVTLRDGGPLLECIVQRVDTQPGEISVLATACAFAPKPGTPLVRLMGAEVPARLVANTRWTGQGSLVTPWVPMIVWTGSDGRQQVVDESSLSIAGLVRSEVGFAGEASNDPAASRLIRWRAPLQSANPPGIDPTPLPPGIDR